MSNTIFTDVSEIEIWGKGVSEISNSQGEIIWRKTPLPEPQSLVFTAAGVASSVSLSNYEGNAPVLYYSYDENEWNEWDYSVLSLNANQKLYLKGDNPTGIGSSIRKYSAFNMTGRIKCSGNIMKLLGENIDSIPSGTGCFINLFNSCSSLISPPKLPATSLSDFCYAGMFWFCPNLQYCPKLPATRLSAGCYQDMFYLCSSITESPILRAASVPVAAYDEMFRGCSLLRKITCFATDAGTYDWSVLNWVRNVAATGTFYKKRGATWLSGDSGIPTGWTVVEVD